MSDEALGDRTLTIDALHQFAYCPRRAFLMHVEGLMAHHAFADRELVAKQAAIEHLIHHDEDQVFIADLLPDAREPRAEPYSQNFRLFTKHGDHHAVSGRSLTRLQVTDLMAIPPAPVPATSGRGLIEARTRNR